MMKLNLSTDRRRKVQSVVMLALLGVCVVAALTPLISVFWTLARNGASAISWTFLTSLPKPVGEVGGGLANGILGSVLMVGLGLVIAVPWGIAVGLLLSEYSDHPRWARATVAVRFICELLSSIPSIVVGIFVYALLVKPFRSFSGIAGAVALAMIMLPLVARISEEVLRLVPNHVREAGLALGLSRGTVMLRIVLRGARGGIMTGAALAVARAAGETAPLLFTALNNQDFGNLTGPTASLPVQIFSYAISPFLDWQAQAWAAAFLLVLGVFAANLSLRLLLSRNHAS